jgi:hypothetical protein
MNQSLLDEFADECRRAVQRLVDEYGFSRERAKRLVFAELASARAPSPSEVRDKNTSIVSIMVVDFNQF